MKTMILVYTTALIAGIATNQPLPEPAITAAELRSPNAVFNFIHAHRQARGATVAWSSSATPATVSGFTVIRTYDDPNDPAAEWYVVSSHACTSARNYRCNEPVVSPGYISYKVLASMNNGDVIESEVRTVHIVQH